MIEIAGGIILAMIILAFLPSILIGVFVIGWWLVRAAFWIFVVLGVVAIFLRVAQFS